MFFAAGTIAGIGTAFAQYPNAMRNHFRALSVLALAIAATNCNGMTSTGPVDDKGTNFTTCDEFRQSLESKKCDVPDPRLIEAVYDECGRRFARVEQACLPAVDRMYRCLTQFNTTCPIGRVDCSTEEREYAECASGGTCHDVGGGSMQPPAAERPVSTYENDEICRCAEETWTAGAPGQACRTFEDCTPTCCTCPDSAYEYTAAACELTETDAGTCPTPDRTCELTRERCRLGR